LPQASVGQSFCSFWLFKFLICCRK